MNKKREGVITNALERVAKKVCKHTIESACIFIFHQPEVPNELACFVDENNEIDSK
ncbi:cyclic lactone autoinducer peptide [Lachnospiraceae bacterium PM6-15]|uniref:cyclic lactone autoinducer peptide n=1 Tax=Ohessyouella blattaphilus TaxID=2949333 RepID=UPI003E30C826